MNGQTVAVQSRHRTVRQIVQLYQMQQSAEGNSLRPEIGRNCGPVCR
ncbi:MAG: hypothetical protein KDA89_21840 [Planctomycetaceae bacterium]|nr:hypothetical protein [Planctomycetaceae bacterium]